MSMERVPSLHKWESDMQDTPKSGKMIYKEKIYHVAM